MKFFSLLATALCAASSMAMAVPLANPEVNEGDLVARARTKTSPKWKVSGKTKPGKGVTGIHTRTDSDGLLTTFIHYGDDVKVHGSHVEYHYLQYPQHAGKQFKLAGGTRKKGEYSDNAKAALKGIKTLGPNWVRDEKPLASLSYGSKWNTVMKVPARESIIEAQLAKLAKSEAGKTGSGRIALLDNRSKTGTGPLGTLLRKRDLQERGLIDSIGDAFDDAKNKTETTIDNGIDDLKNSTLGAAFDKEWEELQSKLDDLLTSVLGDLKDAGDDITDALKQLTFSEDHQVGAFYQGTTNFEATWEGLAANGSTPSNDQLANDQAASDIYLAGFQNATESIGEKVMDAFFAFCSQISDEGDDGSSAGDLFSVRAANYTGPIVTADEVDNTTDDAGNSTVAASRRSVEVKLW